MGASHGSAWGELSVNAVPSVFVDNENTESSDGYVVLDLRVGARMRTAHSVSLEPFFAVTNVLDRTYVGAVVVNSSSGRYFEPAPGRTVQVGLNVSFGS